MKTTDDFAKNRHCERSAATGKLANVDLNSVPLTPTELAAAIFVKEVAAHIDEKKGHKPTRETQKKVAAVVREGFFDK